MLIVEIVKYTSFVVVMNLFVDRGKVLSPGLAHEDFLRRSHRSNKISYACLEEWRRHRCPIFHQRTNTSFIHSIPKRPFLWKTWGKAWISALPKSQRAC